VTSVKVGDRVLPLAGAFGTWTQYNKTDEKNVLPISSEIDVAYAATLTINPSTAYRLLKDFVDLKPGDVIIQNGANSMVGQCVTQLAREMGVTVINVVRANRPHALQTLKLLTYLGIKYKHKSTETQSFKSLLTETTEDVEVPIFDQQYMSINVTDEFLNTREFAELVKDLPPIKLGLNCVGGEATTDLARHLAQGATLVTYGGMSKKPLTIPFDLLTYKGLQCKGFWIADWYATHSVEERKAMYDDLVQAIKDEKLVNFFQMVDLDDFEYALQKSQEPCYLRKIVLNCDYPDRFKEHDRREDEEYFVFDGWFK
jgi:trans-2-enoyl-CoA reductase